MESDASIKPEPDARELRRGRLIGVAFGLVVAAFGLMPLVAIWIDPTGIRAPMWLLEIACGAFIAAGISFILESLGQRLAARIFSFSLIPMLALTAFWALFLDGKGTCSISGGLLGITLRGSAPDWSCRAAFLGIGATALAAALFVTYFVWRRRRSSRVNPTG